MSVSTVPAPDFRAMRRTAFIIGGVALALLAIGFLFSREQFFRSYLWAFLFWLSIGLGCLPLLMLYHLVGGAWGFTLRRIVESGARTLPVMAILFIPIVLGIYDLYEWSREDVVAQSEVLEAKHAYLNIPFWLIRSAMYFGVWSFLALKLHRLSLIQDETGDPALLKRFQRVSGPGLIVFAFTLTFAMFDWSMSLEPAWFSTIYGMLWMVSATLAALSFAVILAAGVIGDRPPLARLTRPANLRDLGNLLLAFVMLWAYLSFSQFLIIWSGNLPEEIPWYLSRLRNGWQWIALVLLVLHFFTPFFLLLSRFLKQQRRTLVIIAAIIFVMRIVDTYWVVTPAFYKDRLSFHVLDFLALVGIGGIWCAIYAGALASTPLTPLHDPETAPHKVI